MPNAELTPKQQWSELIRSAQSILIVPHSNPDGDALGAALALKMALQKLGKEATVAVSGKIGDSYQFMPEFASITREPSIHKDLLVVLDESQAKIGNVSLKRVSENKLIVVITPKDGGILTPANVRVEEGTFNTDLVIVVDCANEERIGALHSQNPNLFYEVPVINVDHHPGNTNFGKVNIVDITASSTSEILVSLIETLGKDVPSLLDPEIATCLLTGLIFDTGSFQNSNTTPKSLTVAAQLVAAGGRQQEIVKHLFKTRSLATLRLWGRALSYLKEDARYQFAWSVLSKADFVASQANQEEGPGGVIDELLKTAAGMRFVMILSEREGGIHGSLRSIAPDSDVSKIAALFGGGGHVQAAAFNLANSQLIHKETEIITTIRNYLSHNEPTASQTIRSASPEPSAPTPTETAYVKNVTDDKAASEKLEDKKEEVEEITIELEESQELHQPSQGNSDTKTGNSPVRTTLR